MFTPVAIALLLAQAESTSGTRITPPTVASVAPLGVSRGTTVELTVEGFNLAKASAIYFSEPGIKGKILRVKELPDLPDIRLGSNGTPSTIDLGPLPPRNQVTVELDIDPDAAIGPVNFRLQTPLGTSPAGTLLVEPYFGEASDSEPNNTPETAFETYLPAILAGTISRPGDIDFYQIKVKAGEELVFDNGAVELNSNLQPLVAIMTADGEVLREYGYDGGRAVARFAHKFPQAGTFYIRVSDYQRSGSARHFYRIKVGRFPVVSGVYPLGLAKGGAGKIALRGFALGTSQVEATGKPAPEDEDAAIVRANTPNGLAFNKVRLALGRDPEVEASAPNQTVAWPVTINGWLDREQTFRIKATKGQKIVLEVNARRLGSDLDSLVEVLDAQGKPIERATVRPVWETITALRDHDSVTRGIRIQSWNALKVGDYVQAGGEIIKIEAIPKTPDDDCIFESFGGQRITYFGTTPEAHANDSAIYKVQIHPPGSKFTPNGLPLARLYYRNDDGGPGYSKDSYLEFVAPADGEYVVRLADSRNEYAKRGGAKDFAYRLNIREPRPDFRLAINPRNPNVPAGGSIPLTVTAFRTDGFTGPIEVELLDLPAGLNATRGVIGSNQINTTILLSADAGTALPTAAPLKAIGRAKTPAGAELAHYASPDDKLKLISLMPPADVVMTAVTKVVEVEPGGTADVEVTIVRQNGFGGRVPVQIMNLPPRVRVLDVGLNGVLINENETKRSFTIEALASAEPIEQTIYVGGQTETRSPLQSVYTAPQTILLRVKPVKKPAAGDRSF